MSLGASISFLNLCGISCFTSCNLKIYRMNLSVYFVVRSPDQKGVAVVVVSILMFLLSYYIIRVGFILKSARTAFGG